MGIDIGIYYFCCVQCFYCVNNQVVDRINVGDKDVFVLQIVCFMSCMNGNCQWFGKGYGFFVCLFWSGNVLSGIDSFKLGKIVIDMWKIYGVVKEVYFNIVVFFMLQIVFVMIVRF